MKVNELIALLEQLPPDMRVVQFINDTSMKYTTPCTLMITDILGDKALIMPDSLLVDTKAIPLCKYLDKVVNNGS